jgi:ABC-type sugar transport system ATPase subunit
MSELRITELSKVFAGGVTALSGLSLVVDEGQTAVVLGPSGCGKTTLLRLVAGLERPTSGSISIGDTDVTHLSPKARDVAMVFQSHALYPHLNVRDNLAFGLKLRSTPKSEIAERVTWAAAMLDIESLLARMPAELSGGQRQRVAVGRAIVRRPRLFLFDEPLSQLDVDLRQKMRSELRQLLAELKTTTLYVTHDQTEARELADVAFTIHGGQASPLNVSI